MKKIARNTSPILLFLLLIPCLRAAELPLSINTIILGMGSAIAILSSYFLFGKRDLRFALFGLMSSLLLAIISVFVVSQLRNGEVFTPDLSLYHLSAVGAVALMAAVGEELVFRGAILGLLTKYLRIFPLVVLLALQAVLFAASHPAQNYLFYFSTFVFGLFAGWATIKTKSLWFSTAFHFGWDFATVFATGYHSRNLGHIKGMVLYESHYAWASNIMLLLATLVALWWFEKFFRYAERHALAKTAGPKYATISPLPIQSPP
jgi:membrane protease YdiL (CAAX protease family)